MRADDDLAAPYLERQSGRGIAKAIKPMLAPAAEPLAAARAEAGPDSDLDLLVGLREVTHRRDQAIAIRKTETQS